MNIREQLEDIEAKILSPKACLSRSSKGRVREEAPHSFRTAFQRDRDRILHSKVGLLIKAADSPGLLAKVASSISALEGNITKAEVKTFADQKAQIKLSLVIRDIKHLDAIMKDISKIKEIFSVERI